MAKKFLLMGILACVTASMAACNTVSGFGKDTQNAGEKIHDTAEDAK